VYGKAYVDLRLLPFSESQTGNFNGADFERLLVLDKMIRHGAILTPIHH